MQSWDSALTAACYLKRPLLPLVFSLFKCTTWVFTSTYEKWLKFQYNPTCKRKGLPRWLSGKNPPTNAGAVDSAVGSGRSLGERNATLSSILAWEIPQTEEPGGYSPWGAGGGHKRVRHDLETEQQQQLEFSHQPVSNDSSLSLTPPIKESPWNLLTISPTSL